MAHDYRNDGPGGLAHVVLATGILMAVALFGDAAEPLREAIFGKHKAPVAIRTAGAAEAQCDANTVSTIIGTLGCGSTRKGAGLSGVTFLSAKKD